MHFKTFTQMLGMALLLTGPAWTFAAEGARLSLELSPSNTELKQNILNHVGDLGERTPEQLQLDSARIQSQAQQALQALGYYQAKIDTQVLTQTPPELVLRIQSGPPVHLNNVRIEIDGPAAQLPAFQQATQQLHRGAQLHHGHYEDTKQLISNLASHYGFFAGHFTQKELLIDPTAGTADIHLVFNSGPRYRLGALNFEGDLPVHESLLRALVPFKDNAPYNADQINELNQALQSTGYFQSVRVDADPESADTQHSIPVHIQLMARKPRNIGFGLGFSTDVGARLRFDGTRYWSNPEGHRYGAEAELSVSRQNLGVWYEIPRSPPLTNKLRYALGYQFQELADTDSMSRLLTLGPEWHTQQENGWNRILSLKWQHEEYRLGDDSGLSTLLMPSVTYNYREADNQTDPKSGYRIEFQLAAAKEGLFSDTDLVHTELLLKGLTTLHERHRLLGRIQLGANITDGEFQNLPPSQRFFAGGDQSVRGYEYQKLSPQNKDDDYVGGRYLVAASAEYQYSLTDTWRLAAFVDQGNAFDTLSRPNLKTSLGLGVRWVSPLGPLRIDLAQPLEKTEGLRLHFSMGPEL